jgi:hypothetical protein
MLSQMNMAETERKMRQGHLSDLYRDAEVHRLLLQTQTRERRVRLNLAQPTAWVVAKLEAAGTSLRQRFVSPCGQFTLWQAEPDC